MSAASLPTWQVLSVKQPFASLLLARFKRYETRDWATRYRGILLIHASKGYDKTDREIARQLWVKFPEFESFLGDYDGLPTGMILGKSRLTEIYTSASIRPYLKEMELSVGNYADGRFAWELKDCEFFQNPAAVRGQLNLWRYTGYIS